MHYLYRRLLKCFLNLSLILPERGDSQLIFVSMKKSGAVNTRTRRDAATGKFVTR